VGAVALGAACERLSEIGMQCVAAHERALAQHLWAVLEEVDGLETLTLWPPGSVDRIGVATFNLEGYRQCPLAAVLSAEHAIAVRHGCFCAHPLITHLLGVDEPEIGRLHAIRRAGPAAAYAHDADADESQPRFARVAASTG